MTFTNKRYLTSQTFEIKNSTLSIERKSLFESLQHQISFEQIDSKRRIQTITNVNLIFVGLFFFLFGLLFQTGPNDELTFIFIGISLVFFLCAVIGRKKVITIITFGGESIELYFTDGNKNEVNEFAIEIITAANAFLLSKYSKVDKDLAIEPQLDQIQFLRNREIITEQQYGTLKNQLLGRENKSSIGFKN